MGALLQNIRRLTVSLHSCTRVKGAAVEAVGDITGSKGWKKSGQKEHADGDAEVTAAQTKAYAQGAKEQGKGYLQSIKGAVLGDSDTQASGAARRELGEAKKEANNPLQ